MTLRERERERELGKHTQSLCKKGISEVWFPLLFFVLFLF
jgi:hypothetical protein